jgi:hypothetical protein
VNPLKFEEFQKNVDFQERELKKLDTKVTIFYLNSVCDEKKIAKELISPFYDKIQIVDYENYLQSFPNWSIEKDEKQAAEKILNGNVIIKLSGNVYSISMKSFNSRAVSESTEENVLQGPKDGLSEKVDTSLNLIRNRYRNQTLRAENHLLGDISKTKIILLYDENLVDQIVLKHVTTILPKLKVDVLQSAGQLQKLLLDSRWSLFPLYLTTERPDRIVKNLAEGKIAFLLEGSSWSLIGPATFFDFFKSMDDNIQLSVVGKFLLLIRYIALLNTIFLPALYVAIISFSPDILQVQFALLIAGSRMSVPFPSYLEILFMMLMTEFLIEASIRLPKTISPTATTVGGLILGQAATQAGLVASVMIIVMSSVALSNFVIPVNAMHQAIRVIRYPLILLGSLFGTIGVVVGAMALLAYLCSLRSLGKPYMRLFQ